MSDTYSIIQYFLSSQFALAFIISITLIPLLKKPTIKLGLIDHPGGRKQHKEPAPLSGGSAIFLTSAISLYFWGIPACRI